MKTILTLFSLLLSPLALADTLQMPTGNAPDFSAEYAALPQKGMLKSRVLAQYGEPIRMSAPVGKPPISRWTYSDFIVFFEHDHVISAVIPGKPRPIYNSEQLRRGSSQ